MHRIKRYHLHQPFDLNQLSNQRLGLRHSIGNPTFEKEKGESLLAFADGVGLSWGRRRPNLALITHWIAWTLKAILSLARKVTWS